MLEKKDLVLLANKLMGNIAEPHNAKEHCQSFVITIRNHYLSTKNFWHC